jgi:ABC-type spermidine/putrescine transport system permease subunit II
MLSPRRRFTIAISSVALGTFAAALLWKSRYGSLKQENINQLIFNFIFAVGIVIGIGLLLANMNKKNDGDKKS